MGVDSQRSITPAQNTEHGQEEGAETQSHHVTIAGFPLACTKARVSLTASDVYTWHPTASGCAVPSCTANSICLHCMCYQDMTSVCHCCCPVVDTLMPTSWPAHSAPLPHGRFLAIQAPCLFQYVSKEVQPPMRRACPAGGTLDQARQGIPQWRG